MDSQVPTHSFQAKMIDLVKKINALGVFNRVDFFHIFTASRATDNSIVSNF